MSDIHYLDLELVLDLQATSLARHGGMPGIRDQGALESAIAQPRAGFGDVELHPTVFDKAAAYLFHLARNHAFLDGNKRVAAASAVVFLAMNGYKLSPETDKGAFYDLAIAAATGAADKPTIATFFRKWCRAA